MRSIFVLGLLSILAACKPAEQPEKTQSNAPASNSPSVDNSSKFAEVAQPEQALPPNLAQLGIQVLLDRAGFSPGVIDGRNSDNLKLALRGFQEARNLKVTGTADAATAAALSNVPATRYVKIPASFASQAFERDLPKDASKQATLPRLTYRSLMEALAERFHTTPETLIALNSPDRLVGANRVIRVPNIAEPSDAVAKDDDRGWNATLQSLAVDTNQPQAAKIVVDKSDRALRVFDADERLIAQFPATMGSKHDPLPLGTWKIQGVSRNPDFHYNPKLFWDVSDRKDDVLLKPGPNGPVGVVWLDLSKPHYGIHGTSEPQTIGSAESHGCVRLTNWDAARLAQMVSKLGIPAVFQK